LSDDLFHFTCDCSAKRIGKYGLIHPCVQPRLGDHRLAWFTDNPLITRQASGLTQHTISCDRMAVLYLVVDRRGALRWNTWADQHCLTLELMAFRDLLEAERMPQFWWVSEGALPVRRIRSNLSFPEAK